VGVVETELGDDAIGPRIDLGFEIIHIGLEGRAFGMLFRIAPDRNFEWRDLLQPRNQIGGIDVAARMGLIGAADAIRRVAAQGDDVADAGRPVGARDLVDFVLRGVHAG